MRAAGPAGSSGCSRLERVLGGFPSARLPLPAACPALAVGETVLGRTEPCQSGAQPFRAMTAAERHAHAAQLWVVRLRAPEAPVTVQGRPGSALVTSEPSSGTRWMWVTLTEEEGALGGGGSGLAAPGRHAVLSPAGCFCREPQDSTQPAGWGSRTGQAGRAFTVFV